MNISISKNIILENPETQPFLADVFLPETKGNLPLVIFCHGYKGYKDWGAWDLMASQFAKHGFYFVKFNFSHNGTTTENPSAFDNLDDFGANNYSKELSDLEFVINYFSKNSSIDVEKITLIGHSRGGGISIIKAFENPKIKNIITLASVDSLNRFPKNDDFEQWKNEGVYYTLNGRTQQKMPHFFQFFEDFENNKDRFSIENAVRNLKQPFLIIHGTADEAVHFSSAERLHDWNSNSKLVAIENANHTFGAKEPWEEAFLPKDLEKATNIAIDFLKID